MKRSLDSSDSLGALMSICPTTTDEHVYTREFQTMLIEGLDEEGCVEELSGPMAEKKRRLSVDQVKALEKNFEVENKLEPERKVKLAQELGLQPRQVAVWFQNRRARWKTKQLERDYGVLKSEYESLKHKYESLQLDNDALLKQICELKAKLNGENSESKVMVKEEAVESESEEQGNDDDPNQFPANSLLKDDETELNVGGGNPLTVFADLKDGSSDSDSSAILNEDNSPHAAAISSLGAFLITTTSNNSSSSSSLSMNTRFQFSENPKANDEKAYQPQLVKIEEHNFFGNEDSWDDEQAPILHWYSPEDWN